MARSEDNLKDLTVALKGLVENLNNPEQRRVNNTNVSPHQFKPDKYVPSLTESPKTWLSKFQSWVEINRYEDLNLIKHSLRLLVPDVDLPWLDSLNPVNANQLYESFIKHFQTKQPTWVIEQTLWNKTMQVGDNLEQYISSIQSLAERLGKSEREKMSSFVRGLPAHLRVTVVQNDPKTFEEAARCARLSQEALTIITNSDGTNVMSPELNTFMERQQSSIDQLTKIIIAMQMEKSEVCAISDRPKITCQLCDKVGHSAKQCFRNKGNDVRDLVRCYHCGKYGHKKAVCRSKQKN